MKGRAKMSTETKTYLLHWLGSDKPQTVQGTCIADACNNAGIGHGAIPALDYYEEVKTIKKEQGQCQQKSK